MFGGTLVMLLRRQQLGADDHSFNHKIHRKNAETLDSRNSFIFTTLHNSSSSPYHFCCCKSAPTKFCPSKLDRVAIWLWRIPLMCCFDFFSLSSKSAVY